MFIVGIVTSILLKTAFWQTSIHSQWLVKILWRSDKDKITFKEIEKLQYGLRETVSKHLNIGNFTFFQLSWCQIELLSCTAKVFSVLLKQMKMLFAKLINFCLSSILFYFHLPLCICLVPVRRFPSPYRSTHFGDVSEANWRKTPRKKTKCACVQCFLKFKGVR